MTGIITSPNPLKLHDFDLSNDERLTVPPPTHPTISVGDILYRYESHTQASEPNSGVAGDVTITLERYKVLSVTKKSVHLVLLNSAVAGDIATHTKKRMYFRTNILFANPSMLRAKLDFIRRKLFYISALVRKMKAAEDAIEIVKSTLDGTPM